MNNLFKIILIIFALNFLFKNNKVEKFGKKCNKKCIKRIKKCLKKNFKGKKCNTNENKIIKKCKIPVNALTKKQTNSLESYFSKVCVKKKRKRKRKRKNKKSVVDEEIEKDNEKKNNIVEISDQSAIPISQDDAEGTDDTKSYQSATPISQDDAEGTPDSATPISQEEESTPDSATPISQDDAEGTDDTKSDQSATTISQDDADKLNNSNLWKEFKKRKNKKCTNNNDCVGQGVCNNNICSWIPCKKHEDCSIGDVRFGFCVDSRYCQNYDADQWNRRNSIDKCGTIKTDEECRNTKGQNNKCMKTRYTNTDGLNPFTYNCRSDEYYNKIKEKENQACFVNFSHCGNEMKCEPKPGNEYEGTCQFWSKRD